MDSVDIFEMLHNKIFLEKVWVNDENYKQFQEYRAKYGVE